LALLPLVVVFKLPSISAGDELLLIFIQMILLLALLELHGINAHQAAAAAVQPSAPTSGCANNCLLFESDESIGAWQHPTQANPILCQRSPAGLGCVHGQQLHPTAAE
jgi:hypothetical protein